jgi:hypothetical protein
MSNLTMSIDEAILRKARKRAIDRNVSLTELVRGYLLRLAAEEDLQREATAAGLLQAFEHADVVVGPRRWTREDLHER